MVSREIAFRKAAGRVAIRDSIPVGPILVYTLAEFGAFLEGAKNGEFDWFLL